MTHSGKEGEDVNEFLLNITLGYRFDFNTFGSQSKRRRINADKALKGKNIKANSMHGIYWKPKANRVGRSMQLNRFKAVHDYKATRPITARSSVVAPNRVQLRFNVVRFISY